MPLPEHQRAGTLWYVSDGLVWDELPLDYRSQGKRALECASKLLVFNPQARAADVTARLHHTDREPTVLKLSVGPREIAEIDLAGAPHRQSFWIVVESNVPVLPQACHEDHTFWDPVPDALISVAPYPGPLTDETSWVFPDCYESDPVGSWYERETLTILNPHAEAVRARVRYLLRGLEPAGEEEIEIPPERVAQLNVWERAPRPEGDRRGPPLRVIGDYSVRVDATAPVVAQTTRRARWSGYPSVIGARSTMGMPQRGGGHDLWYYPGGAIVDRGILPRAAEAVHPLSQCDNTWNLLFVNNPHAHEEARATISFHRSDGSSSRAHPLAIQPRHSDLRCLHAKPWLGEHTWVGEPFALTVSADRPIVPEVTCAEFEMWSQVMPGAMSAVNLYSGPLQDERTWWLGIGPAGGADEENLEWAQTYHLFNPGAEEVNVRLSFLGLPGEGAPSHDVRVPAGAVAIVESTEVAGLPLGCAFAVRATGDGPFCAQVFVRAFTRGLRHTRAMYSIMGLPMTLEA